MRAHARMVYANCGTIGSRYAIGTRTLEVRLGLLLGDIGAGVRTVTMGLVVTP